MSTLFGKPDYKKTLNIYVNKGEYGKALKIAVKNGDKFYDEDEITKAIDVYLFLLSLLKGKNVIEHSLYERLYEKLIPLLFEDSQEEEALNYSLDLIDEKLMLKKDREAFDILNALKEQFPESEAVVLKAVEVNLSKDDVNNALKELDNAISSIGPKPKFIELAGEILLKIHRYEDAYDYFNALLAVDPDNQLAKQRISELESAFALSKAPKIKAKKTKNEPTSGNTEVGNVEKTKEMVKKVFENSSKLSESYERKQGTPELKGKRNTLSELKENKNSTDKKVIPNKQPTRSEVNVKKNDKSNYLSNEINNSTSKISKSTEHEEDEVIERDKYKPLLTVVKDPLYISAIKTFLKDEKQGYDALISVAERYETINLIDAEYVYLKLFLFAPRNSRVARKLISLYDKIESIYDVKEVKAEKLFVSFIAVKNNSGAEKLEFLKQMERELPVELFVKVQIFKTLSTLGREEEALKYFVDIRDKINNNDLNEIADIAFATVKDDAQGLEVIAHTLYNKRIKTSESFKYFYTLGNILFNSGNKPDGLKWLLRANEVNKLSLDDYIKIAEYIKELPLDTEKDVVAAALNGYVGVVSKDKKDYLFRLILSLKPHNTLYIRHYAEYLSIEKSFKEEAGVLKLLVEKSDLNLAEFINNKMREIAPYLSIDDLREFEKFFNLAKLNAGLLSVYEIMLQKDPSNEEAKIKYLVISIEMEDESNILHFFSENEPSHEYINLVSDKITEYEQMRIKSMLDYHIHFVLGFLYYLVERFEESIASLQFVVRSHRFEPLMHLFLGMSFEKIALSEFALKQYQMIIDSGVENNEVTALALYRMAIIAQKSGDIRKSLELAKRSYALFADENVEKFINNIPGDSEGKIIKMEDKDK